LDTDGDGKIDWDWLFACIYQLLDNPCPKHSTEYCVPEDCDYWKGVACDGNPAFMYEMIDDYLLRIQHLSIVLNEGDSLNTTVLFDPLSEWKYNDSDINFGDSWVNLGYDDSGWSSGDAYLGYNETEITTNLSYGGDPTNKTVTYYFRKHFNIGNTSKIDSAKFSIDYDDGFVAYLNGNEFLRSTGASTDHYDYVPYHESSIGDNPGPWLFYELSPTEIGYLVDGDNVIAIEMHQTGPTSTDIALAAYLVSYENITGGGLMNNLSEMCDILSVTSTDEEELKKQLLTAWLNVVSADICYTQDIVHGESAACGGISADAIDELIGAAENALITGQTSEYGDIAAELSLLNNGDCLGCVPEEEEEEGIPSARGGTRLAYCNDRICQADESCWTCPEDCGECCGDGICEFYEPNYCEEDCLIVIEPRVFEEEEEPFFEEEVEFVGRVEREAPEKPFPEVPPWEIAVVLAILGISIIVMVRVFMMPRKPRF
jgi:hypothetical protein